jgi:hypothetical protein
VSRRTRLIRVTFCVLAALLVPAGCRGDARLTASPTAALSPVPSAVPTTVPTATASPFYAAGQPHPFGFTLTRADNRALTLCEGYQPCAFSATLLSRQAAAAGAAGSQPYGGTDYLLQPADGSAPVALTVRGGYDKALALEDGVTYHFVAQVSRGWPDTHGLLVRQAGAVVYYGVSDWYPGASQLAGCLAPVWLDGTRVLRERYLPGDGCVDRITNLQVTFSSDGGSVTLHQGESATLDEYRIDLAIAVTVDRVLCPDAGGNTISYTVSRAGQGGAVSAAELTPAEIADPGLEATLRLLLDRPDGILTNGDLQGLRCLIPARPGLQAAYYDAAPRPGSLQGLEVAANLRLVSLPGAGTLDLSPLAGAGQLEQFDINHSEISVLEPLAGMTALRDLDISNNWVSDLSPLASLTALEDLYARHNGIADLRPLANLAGLRSLNLDENPVRDLSPLAGLAGLASLSLYETEVEDLGPLAGLSAMARLNLESSAVADLGPLAALVGLRELGASRTAIADLSPLAGLTGLTDLRLADCAIAEIGALAGLTALRALDLSGNRIGDIAPLVANPGLGAGDVVDLRGNPLTSRQAAGALAALRARGVRVEYREDSASQPPAPPRTNIPLEPTAAAPGGPVPAQTIVEKESAP